MNYKKSTICATMPTALKKAMIRVTKQSSKDDMERGFWIYKDMVRPAWDWTKLIKGERKILKLAHSYMDAFTISALVDSKLMKLGTFHTHPHASILPSFDDLFQSLQNKVGFACIGSRGKVRCYTDLDKPAFKERLLWFIKQGTGEPETEKQALKRFEKYLHYNGYCDIHFKVHKRTR